jgi:hypothetical protein
LAAEVRGAKAYLSNIPLVGESSSPRAGLCPPVNNCYAVCEIAVGFNHKHLWEVRAMLRRAITLLTIFATVSLSVIAGDDKTKPKDDPDAIGNRNVGQGINFYSLEKEIALGKQLTQEVERQAKIVDDPIIAEYVNRTGQNLVRNSDAKVPFTIKVLDTEEVNAFALPGGFFFVNSGLILKTETEAELAGVMGHEIAHVAARHGTRKATKGESRLPCPTLRYDLVHPGSNVSDMDGQGPLRYCRSDVGNECRRYSVAA